MLLRFDSESNGYTVIEYSEREEWLDMVNQIPKHYKVSYWEKNDIYIIIINNNFANYKTYPEFLNYLSTRGA